MTVSRRDFLLGAVGLAATMTGCAGGADSDAKHLNILNWADYLHPDAIPEFERRYGIKVIYDTFASNEALMSKLQAGGTKYDIIVPSSYMVKQLKRLQLLDVLNHDRIKGLDMLMPRFRHSLFDPGLKHCVPYTWGTTGIGYNLDDLKSRLSLKSDNVGRLSWDVFWDSRLSQRMTLLDDGREVIGMALKKSGHSYNSREQSQISDATHNLIGQKPLVMAYTSDQVIVELTSGDAYLSQVFSGDAYQARRENPLVRYVIPKEGASIWTDNFCIPVSAPHKNNAYLWINYMLEPAVAAACANFTHYATANWGAFKGVEAELKNDLNLYPSESILNSCEELEDIGSAIFIYDKMWTELKCY